MGADFKDEEFTGMSGKSVRMYVTKLLRELDEKLDPQMLRKTAIALAIPTLAIAPSCVALYGTPDYGAPFEEYDCQDGYDDDYDGFVDCEDPDCRGFEICLSCFDGQDNDDDGLADCADDSCVNTEGCLGECDDGDDDDDDGLVDCNDPDCDENDACQ